MTLLQSRVNVGQPVWTMEEVMSRPLRLQYEGAVYHLTSRGNARQKIFWNDDDRKLFLGTLSRVVKRFGWICHASAKFRVSRLGFRVALPQSLPPPR
jgi:hypothetical protein